MDANTSWVLLFAFSIIGAFAVVFAVFWFTWWSSKREGVCPYTGLPLRRATDLSYYTCEKALQYMYDFRQYDNPVFKLSKAAYSRETGRIFTNCINIFDTIHVDWSFLNKRYPGVYVSWGSLNPEQQAAVRKIHGPLDAFQTEISSPTPSPRAIEPEFCYTKPGPLYINFETKVLLGWQIVPGTEVEVLVMQKPIK